MKNNFLTIAKNNTHEIDIKKSKFITTIVRINSEDEAKNMIAKIVQDNKKANHNCFAYVIGENDEIQRESDNGEPSGTAGVPILDVIKNNKLHDTLIVVTRYFGGIKLGAGGLIRAYSNSASQIIEATGIVQKVLKTEIKLKVSYKLNEKLKYFLTQNDFPILNTDYGKEVVLTTAVAAANVKKFEQAIINLLADNIQITKGADKYFEEPYKKSWQ